MLIDVADYFRLDRREAAAILGSIATATSQWEAVAEAFGLPKSSIEMMAPAFVNEQSIAVEALRH